MTQSVSCQPVTCCHSRPLKLNQKNIGDSDTCLTPEGTGVWDRKELETSGGRKENWVSKLLRRKPRTILTEQHSSSSRFLRADPTRLLWAVLEVSWLEMKCCPKHTWMRLWTSTPSPQENLNKASTLQEDFKTLINYFSHLMGPDLAVYSTLGQLFSSIQRRMPSMITDTGRLVLLQGKTSKTPGLILNFLQAL